MSPLRTTPFPSRLRPASAVVLSLFASISAWAGTAGAPGTPATPAASPSRDYGLLAEVNFNDAFLQQPDGTRLDVSRFNQGNLAAPGEYRADLYVNQVWLGRAAVLLRQVGDDPRNVQPCLDRDLLARIGVDLNKLTPEAVARLEHAERSEGAEGAHTCAPLPELVPNASATFDNGEQRLDVSVPQAAMARQARGYVDPRYWDDGVPAARLQYTGNVYDVDTAGMSSTQAYLGLNAGFNVGPWRFRHLGNLTRDEWAGTHYQSVQTSLQRAIVPLRSQLTFGDAFTDGTMFDSVGFRGVQMATDDRMYPESQRGYAPTVRGIANSNARVQVRQNGNLIFDTTVAPGPFEINDLYPTGYGGDLEVTVTEADGNVHTSRVPYAAAVNALRPGVTRYSVTAGQYRNSAVHGTPTMFQATVQHGFTNLLTGYGGVTAARDYAAAVAGVALNTDFGAIGADVTQAYARLAGQASRNGQSLRLSYSKLLVPTSTNLTLAAYRYSSSGFLSLTDAVALRDLDNRNLAYLMNGITRGRLQVTISQSLPPGYGHFFLAGSMQDYWNRDGTDTQFQAGYSNIYRRISYGVTAARQFNVGIGRWENRVMLTIGIPLGSGQHAPYAMTNYSRDSRGATGLQESVTGTLGVDNAFSYGVNAGYTGGGGSRDTASGGANASYVSPVATLTANASTSRDYTQAGFGLSGGIVAYAGGVAFAPTVGDTMAIVEARDATGARITNASGLRVDPWGHALVPTLTPFASNQIEIDPQGLPMSVELKATQQHVAPTSGAIVRMAFETSNAGRGALIRAARADGKPLPFGADVFDAQGNSIGTVGQGGRVIARGLKDDQGRLTVTWGQGAAESCSIDYAITPREGADTGWLVLPDTVCR